MVKQLHRKDMSHIPIFRIFTVGACAMVSRLDMGFKRIPHLGIRMKGGGRMDGLMDMVCFIGLMEIDMKVDGRVGFNMDMPS
jgi:hypothetical protein